MSRDSKVEYSPLLAESNDFSEGQTGTPSKTHISPRRRVIVLAAFVAQSLIILALVGTILRKETARCSVKSVFPQGLYSPAQEALDYEPRTFTMGFGDPTIYQGDPSPEVDEAWLDLYNTFGLSAIPKSQARLLPNRTLAIPGNESYYAVGLSVFHQLHCLNLIRQGLAPDHYTDYDKGTIAGVSFEEWPSHLSHCIDNIRQSIMCASDISLVVWQWDDTVESASIHMDTVHSCRNHDKIANWAKANKRINHFDMKVHVKDDIEIPVF